MRKRLWFFLTCLMLSAGMAFAQKSVTGTVTDLTTGEPLVGVHIRVNDHALGITDVNGRFNLTGVPENVSVLDFSYIGYKDTRVHVSSDMAVKMEQDSQNLDQVIIVAYGTQKRESLTGAVAQIGAQEIGERIGTSVTGALEGAAPGIQVNNTYGEPGAAPSIVIRGIGTLTGTSAPLYILDGAEFSGNIAEINSNDIETISVLKDAAACALYGSRAANGVVLITTKKGRGSNTPSITLQVNQGMYTRGISEYSRMGARQWMETAWMAMKNYAQSNEALALSADDAAAYATAHLVGDYARVNIFDGNATNLFDANGKLTANMLSGYADDLDWEDAIERTGHRQEYNLSTSMSGEKFSLFSSVGYLKEKGYVMATDYTRFSGRINTEYKPTTWLTTGINLNAVGTKRNYNDNATSTYYANPFYTARNMAPIYAMHYHNADGTYMLDDFGQPIYDTTSDYLDNRHMVYELENDKQDNRRNVINGLAYATINLPYDFSLTFKGEVENSTSNLRHYNNPEIGDGATNNGRLRFNSGQYTSYMFNQVLNWNHSYGQHNIEALIGHEANDYTYKTNYGLNTDMAVKGNFVMTNFLTNSYLYGYDDEYSKESYFGRAAYNYNMKYIGEFSFRRDGSSRFAKGNRWGNFFSIGGAWNMTREDWLSDVDWLNNLKLHAAYGEVGNDAAVSYYAYQALYGIEKNGGKAAFVKSQLAANDIKWETTRTFDLGVDLRLFDRLDISLGYYNKTSKDLLFDVKLPLSAGSYIWSETQNMTQPQNIGKVSNRGLEIGINYEAFNRADLKWNIGFDATLPSNRIKKLYNGEDYILGATRTYREGRSLYEWYTYHFEGVDQMTGRSLYTIDPDKAASAADNGALVTINGTDYTTQTTYAQKKVAGEALPTIYGSLKSYLQWKDLSVNLLFTYSLGGKTYDGVYQTLMSTNSASSASAYHKDLANAWNGVPAGMTEDSPNRINPNGTPIADFTYSTDCNATSDRWLTSASYFVFKNINVTYNLPLKWANSLGIRGLQVSAGIENLFTITSRKGLNPQYSFTGGYDYTYVTPRVYNLGLTVNF